MTVDVSVTIVGLQEAQDANLRAIAALRPGGAIDEAIREVTLRAHRHLVAVTHVDTGAYRAAHRIKMTKDRGVIFVDTGARNPRSGRRVVEYAPIEEARGSSHAAYARTEAEMGAAALDAGIRLIADRIGW